MFAVLEMAPPDAILGLTEAFKKDPRDTKINLGVGVYKDADNATPILETVKQAEERLLTQEKTKNYLGIPGSSEYARAVQGLLLGPEHEAVKTGRVQTAHTPGGTGALRVSADFIHTRFPGASIWMSDPTWANHPSVFEAAGLTIKTYPYYDYGTKGLDFDGMMDGLRQVAEGDVVLLHACCHNPSGMDPDPEQWSAIASLAAKQKFLPLVDFAYQGFADGIDADALAVRTLAEAGCEMLICSSFSKNFGLYCERVGALSVVGEDAGAADRAFSHVKTCIRANYSNPPAHGAHIVSTILEDPALRGPWEAEVAAMRDRINGMRQLFVDTLAAKGVRKDFSFITRQKGMFSFSGLNKEQVARLKEEYAIYIVGSGRINVAGMTADNMDYLCEAIAAVL
jgi:aspartate aminotransferase